MADLTVRDRLLGSALALFVAEGYDGVSIEKVRKAARVSNGSFFHLFRTKADLAAEVLIACVAEYQASVTAALGAAPSAPDGIAAAIGAHLQWVQKNRSKARFMLDDARSAWFPLAADRLRACNRQFMAAVEQWREPLLARGELQPVPIEVFSATLLGPANLLCRMWLAGLKPSAIRPMRYQEALVELSVRALVPARKGDAR